MTVVVLQAAAARRVWQTDPPLAAEHVHVLRETVSEMLRDLRPLVLSLALDDTRQTLSLAGVPQLAERACDCGLQVTLDIATAALSPTLEAAV
jgi:signal transduction histidine kinase